MFSNHAWARMRQRGISEADVELLLAYGRCIHRRGAEVYVLDKRGAQRLQRHGVEPCVVERLRHQFVVADGAVITVGHRHRRLFRDGQRCHRPREREHHGNLALRELT